MKKSFLLILILLLTASCIIGCSNAQTPPADAVSSTPSSGQSSVSPETPPADPEAGDAVSSAPVHSEVPVAPPTEDVTPTPGTNPVPLPPDTPTQPAEPPLQTDPPAEPATPADPPAEPVVPAEPETSLPVESPAEPPEQTDSTYVYHEKVPILMYHEVNDLLANSLYLSVADFISHLDYFEEAGITPISMKQLYDHWFNEAPLPEKPIVLTFDDGYRSMYTTVFPLLKERGWSGTFYCITAGRWSDNFVTAEMIAEMAAGGMEIGSHTDNHVELDKLSESKRASELTKSKSILETITGQEITALCYPAGKYNDETEVASADAGYLTAVTTKSGIATKSQGMFALRRVRVSTDCGAAWLKSTLAPLGY